MKLILIRHAKSAWDDPNVEDHDRVLNARGRKAAAAIGGWLRDQGHIPELALISTAARALETWDRVAACLPAKAALHKERALYLSSPGTMLDHIATQAPKSLVLVAHNPGMALLMAQLVQTRPDHPDFGRCPTGATLVLDHDAPDWAGISQARLRVRDYCVPRDLI